MCALHRCSFRPHVVRKRGGERLGVRFAGGAWGHLGRNRGVPAALCLFFESHSW